MECVDKNGRMVELNESRGGGNSDWLVGGSGFL